MSTKQPQSVYLAVDADLFSSWWNGANIPGKKAECMIYVGGINMYEAQCREKIDGWKGFDVVTSA